MFTRLCLLSLGAPQGRMAVLNLLVVGVSERRKVERAVHKLRTSPILRSSVRVVANLAADTEKLKLVCTILLPKPAKSGGSESQRPARTILSML